MKDRTRKVLASILSASVLLYTPSAFALRGGPFDNNRASTETAAGTYSAVMTGNNLIGLVQFGVSDSTESNGRFAVFHEGIMNYGVCTAIADAANGVIAGALLGIAGLPGEATPASGTPDTTTQQITVRSAAEGAFKAEMKDYPVNITFQGDGEISTYANPVTLTEDVVGSSVVVNAGGTADNNGTAGSQSVTVSSVTHVNGTTVRARTPFEIRGSRTSNTQYSAINSFTGITPVDPGFTATTTTTTP